MIREAIEGYDWEFPCVLYKPSKMEENLPLVIQLHGAGEAGKGGAELCSVDRFGFSVMLNTGKEYPCIFAMPQCSPDSFWAAEIPNIFAFIQRVVELYHVDRNRIYLAGISMGAYGTWLTASRYPTLFAAIAPVCGGGMVWKADALKMPVWAFHGTEDDIVYPTESLNMIRKIRTVCAEDQDVRLTMFDGVAHNAWDYTFDEELLTWLLSKHR